jgi:hypothetical protein
VGRGRMGEGAMRWWSRERQRGGAGEMIMYRKGGRQCIERI